MTDCCGGLSTLHLERPLTPGAVTRLTYTDEEGTQSSARFLVHPGNVNGDAVADVADVAALVEILARRANATWWHYSTDCDHSGSTTPADLLCLVDLLNGAGAFAPGWMGTPLPDTSGACAP